MSSELLKMLPCIGLITLAPKDVSVSVHQAAVLALGVPVSLILFQPALPWGGGK